jgi:hypothetical protein
MGAAYKEILSILLCVSLMYCQCFEDFICIRADVMSWHSCLSRSGPIGEQSACVLSLCCLQNVMSVGSGVEIREKPRRDPSCWPRGTLYPQKVGTNFAYKRRRSVGIVKIQATEFLFYVSRMEQNYDMLRI